MTIQFNEEQFEAAQAEVDRIKHEFLKTLSDEELRRHKVMEDCVKTLTEEKIPFHLFATVGPKGEFWQYNSIHRCFYLDINKDNSRAEDIQRHNMNLLLAVFDVFRSTPALTAIAKTEDKIDDWTSFVNTLLKSANAEKIELENLAEREGELS